MTIADDIAQVKACSCHGKFSGIVTSLNPVTVSSRCAGDDCITFVTFAGNPAFGGGTSNFAEIENDDDWRVWVAPETPDPGAFDELSVGDICFNLQMHCQPCFDIYWKYAHPHFEARRAAAKENAS